MLRAIHDKKMDDELIGFCEEIKNRYFAEYKE